MKNSQFFEKIFQSHAVPNLKNHYFLNQKFTKIFKKFKNFQNFESQCERGPTASKTTSKIDEKIIKIKFFSRLRFHKFSKVVKICEKIFQSHAVPN